MNYDKVLENTLKNLNFTPTLLLHSCCAPCSSYVIEYLANYFKITVFYYNPNIDTSLEYEKRKEEEIRFIREFKAKNPVDFVDLGYLKSEYLNEIAGMEDEKEGGARCFACYKLRLKRTCLYAKENNFDYFTTTLTVSPYKNSKVINEIGAALATQFGVNYLSSDFKKKNGYKRSIELSKEYNLYRQDYCGCEHSKRKAVID